MPTNDHSAPLNATERALASFTPAAPAIDRDRLMFLAGRASVEGVGAGPGLPAARRRAAWLWPAATAVLAATSLSLALMLAWRSPSPVIVYRDRTLPPPAVPLPQPSEPAPVEQTLVFAPPTERNPREPSGAYLKTRDVALRMGLDALGSPPHSATSTSSASYRDLWQGFISAPNAAPNKTSKQTAM